MTRVGVTQGDTCQVPTFSGTVNKTVTKSKVKSKKVYVQTTKKIFLPVVVPVATVLVNGSPEFSSFVGISSPILNLRQL